MAFELLIYPPDGADMDSAMRKRLKNWLDDLRAQDLLIFAGPLYPAGAANYVHRDSGSPQIEEGPVLNETHVVSGTEYVRCKTMEEALELASRHPALELSNTRIEVREVWGLFEDDQA